MKLTRRGRGVAAILAAASLAFVLHGPRGLDAVIVPGLVAFAVAVVQVRRATFPEVERRLPERGHRGETVTVRLDVDADRPVSGSLHDEVGEGLDATGNDRLVTLTGDGVEYELALATRGEGAVGPLSIEVTDVLGLVSKRRRYRGRDRILVRPRVLPLSIRPRETYADEGDLGPERGAFEYLREYEPGDPIRDVHWKSSAKTTDGFLVTEFASDDEGVEAVTVGVEAVSGDRDATADAAASLVAFLLESGLDVGLRTASTEIEPGSGVEHRERTLDLLARDRYITGRLPDRFRAETDLVVRGTDDGVALETGQRTVDLGRYLDSGAEIPTDDAPPMPT